MLISSLGSVTLTFVEPIRGIKVHSTPTSNTCGLRGVAEMVIV